MDEFVKLIVPAIIGSISGVASALLAARLRINEFEKQFEFKIKELAKQLEFKRLEEREKEIVALKTVYIAPLRRAASDLLTRMKEIIDNLSKKNPAERIHFRESLERIVLDKRDDAREFALWCNGGGYHAVSTLYRTAIFFARQSKIRSELPFTKVRPDYGQALHERLVRVRTAFGGRYGVWENLQDSIGDYICKHDGTIYNYKEFCEDIIDKSRWVWFSNLIDFYKDIEKKREFELPPILESLAALIEFLDHTELDLLGGNSATKALTQESRPPQPLLK